MSSLSSKDRVSLCSFTFSDGRRCRTPRTRNNTRFCPYHAQKEARARAAQKLGKDLDYFFSGDYLSACDLSTALARLIPAVIRGDVKPRTARTVAYMAQTLLQAIHISQHEYSYAFGDDGWRKAVRNSVNSNHDYLFPPDPEPEQPALSALRTNLRSESPQPQPQPASQPAETPVNYHFERAETPVNCHLERAETSVNCHSERSEEPAFSASRPGHSPLVTLHLPLPQAEGSSPFPPAELPEHLARNPVRTVAASLDPVAHTAPNYPVCHPERSEGSHPLPATQSAPSVVPPAHPDNPPRTGPPTPRPAPNRDPHALHFDHSYRLRIDGKPF